MSLLVDSRLSTTVRFSRRWSAISAAFSKRSGFTSTTWSWVVVWMLTTLLLRRGSGSTAYSAPVASRGFSLRSTRETGSKSSNASSSSSSSS